VLELDLAGNIGPLAKILVRNSAQTTSDVQALCEQLAKHISDEAEQKSFLEKSLKTAQSMTTTAPTANDTPGAAGTAVNLDVHALEVVEKRLARHIGPLAKVLVRKAADETTSMAELCQNLSQHISDEEEKARFLEDSSPQPTNQPLKPAQPASRWRWGHVR
jgi:serine/threonine-protein kinase